MSEQSDKPRILIVEDSLANIRLLAAGLEEDYEIAFAKSGPEALRAAVSDPQPELILLDIIMPDMDGYDVCRILKANMVTKNIPVIFLTGMSEVEDETRGLEIGAVDYITKPFSMAIVKARMRTHLELKRHRDMFEQIASLDGLTGIPNRRRFDEVYDVEWKRAMRGESALSVLMIDIDHFKAYNDQYGHGAGDECIKRVATTLAECVRRAGDFLARYGGEEFVGLLSDTSPAGAAGVAEAMRASVSDLGVPHSSSSAAGVVTISVGVATGVPTSDDAPVSLVESADTALYAAKRGGRNRVVISGATGNWPPAPPPRWGQPARPRVGRLRLPRAADAWCAALRPLRPSPFGRVARPRAAVDRRVFQAAFPAFS